jgi:hypothetical protein
MVINLPMNDKPGPPTANSLTSTPVLCAMKPKTEKIANPFEFKLE